MVMHKVTIELTDIEFEKFNLVATRLSQLPAIKMAGM